MNTVGEVIDKMIKDLENIEVMATHLKMTVSYRWEDGLKFVTIEAGAHR